MNTCTGSDWSFDLSVVGLWIVRQVAIRSDPRFMSYDSQIELRVTGN